MKLKQLHEDSKKQGYIDNIDIATTENNNFREVLYTSDNLQLVVMNINAGEDIGEETHKSSDQFIRIEEGTGKVIINGATTKIKADSAFIIPKGSKHNIINTGSKPLKLYSIYSPPHHADGIVDKTKNSAKHTSFDGKTTE